MDAASDRRDEQQARIVPQLSVRRGRAAIEFYKAAFGVLEDYRVGGAHDGEDVVAQLSIGDAAFWVSDESPPHRHFSPESLRGATARMLLVVEDPRSAVERAITAGATAIYPVSDEHGWRLGRVEDPFGHHWEIGKPLVPWPPTCPFGSDDASSASTMSRWQLRRGASRRPAVSTETCSDWWRP